LIDGRAVVALLNEVFAFYEAFSQGKQLELPLPREFQDFIGWLNQQDLGRAEKYWRAALKGFTAPTALAIAHASNGETQIRGEQQIRLFGFLSDVYHMSLAGRVEVAEFS